jgi:hypothetical protein
MPSALLFYSLIFEYALEIITEPLGVGGWIIPNAE